MQTPGDAAARRLSKAIRLAAAALSLLLTLGLLAVAEKLSPDFLRGTETMPELEVGFAKPFPAIYSDYLPLTTPRGREVEGQKFGRITFNELGYRGPDPGQIRKPPGRRRLLVLGDSFTLGWGVVESESIPAQLRARLAPEGWEVINAGYHAGYSPDAYYAYLVREAPALEIDVIALQVFTGNDVVDVGDNIWQEVDASGGPVRLRTIRANPDYTGGILDPRVLPWGYHVPLLNRSRLFCAATNVVSAWSNRRVPMAVGGRIGVPLSPDAALARFHLSLRAIAAYSRRTRIPLVVVSFSWIGSRPEEDAFRPGIERLLTELEVPHRSLHDLLTRAHRLVGDPHTNAEGNRRIAESILGLAGLSGASAVDGPPTPNYRPGAPP